MVFLAPLALALVIGTRPNRLGNRVSRPFVKTLPQKLGARPAKMHPFLLPAALRYRCNPAVFLHLCRTPIPIARHYHFARCEPKAASKRGANAEFKEYPPESKPIAGKYIRTRVSPGEAGSHAISGSWKAAKLEDVSENALTFTLKGSADGLSMQSGTGESYDAKFDGKDYPVKGPRPGRTISLNKVDDTTIEETYKEDGKPVSISRVTVAGNTLKYVSKDPRRGTTTSFTADKQ
jgi:hypothetical protein